VQFGTSDDKLLQADFDGDGKRDIAVYRQSSGVWYYLRSSDGAFVARQFGGTLESALPAIYVP
ncbi:MAG TPA: FG-GAP-like repeat-containing protein, partial [Pyrinomonadaceae bacterium]|nr:FG-GAP-like repeat-containing protein [Pyrinomonadaceae bacterium]